MLCPQQVHGAHYENLLTIVNVSFTNINEGLGGACGVMIIVVGNGHDDTSSIPGQD